MALWFIMNLNILPSNVVTTTNKCACCLKLFAGLARHLILSSSIVTMRILSSKILRNFVLSSFFFIFPLEFQRESLAFFGGFDTFLTYLHIVYTRSLPTLAIPNAYRLRSLTTQRIFKSGKIQYPVSFWICKADYFIIYFIKQYTIQATQIPSSLAA